MTVCSAPQQEWEAEGRLRIQFFARAQHVKYKSDRPCLNLIESPDRDDAEQRRKVADKLFTTSEDWRHEVALRWNDAKAWLHFVDTVPSPLKGGSVEQPDRGFQTRGRFAAYPQANLNRPAVHGRKDLAPAIEGTLRDGLFPKNSWPRHPMAGLPLSGHEQPTFKAGQAGPPARAILAWTRDAQPH